MRFFSNTTLENQVCRPKSGINLYPFGMQMPGRTYQGSSAYRYGMNGQEKDDEIFQGAYTAEYWEYDSRIGRRWNIDPITYPSQSSYACFNNNPIKYADPMGLKGDDVIKATWNEGTGKYDHVKVSDEYGPDVTLTQYEGGAMDGKNIVESPRGKWTFDPKPAQYSINVMIVHGQGGKNSPTFGGRYGGHVGIQIGDNSYGFTNDKHGSHLFAHGSNGRNSYFERDNYATDEGNAYRWDLSRDGHLTHFTIPVTEEQYNDLKNSYDANVANSKGHNNSKYPYNVPYDYAIIGGRRCASSAYNMLTNSKILEKQTLFLDRAIHSLTPGQFYRYLKSTSKAQGWSINSNFDETKNDGYNSYQRNIFDKIFDSQQ